MNKSKNLFLILLLCTTPLLIGSLCSPNDSDDDDPGVFVNLFIPRNGETLSSQNALFKWSCYGEVIDVEFDTILFRIRHDTASVFAETTIDYDDPHISHVVGDLSPATTYYWNVYCSAHESDGTRWTRLSNTRSVTMADRLYLQGEPHSPVPDSGAVGVSIVTGFAWELFNPDTLVYEFDVYLGTTTNPSLLASGLVDQNYSLVNDTLEYATVYFWRVDAYAGTDTVSSPLWRFTTDYPAEVDIFALIEVDAKQAPSGYHVMEEIRTRFDSAVAIDTPINALQADSVLVEGTRLDWNATTHSYSYTEFSMPFIENGQPVDIVVYGNGDVPGMSISPLFPACTLSIVSPESFETVSLTGFEVTWEGSECGGTVMLTLLDGTNPTGVWMETANDGIDTLTASDLAPLGGQTGAYDLVIMKLTQQNISAPGYSSQSLFRARSYNTMTQINISSK